MIPWRDSQHSPGSGDYMNTKTGTCGIRAAQCKIEDKSHVLKVLQDSARRFDTHIICFNADMIAGRRHVEAAVWHAIRSFEAGEAISNTLEMEALLYAAGSRQCQVAASFGLHEGDNRLWVCCYPLRDEVWSSLEPDMQFLMGEAWMHIDDTKRERLMQLFEITPEELDSLQRADQIVDLVLERVALLRVAR